MSRRFVISAAAWIVIGTACAKGDEARLAKIKDTVCACKSAGCAEVAMKDVPQQEIVSNHRTQQLARQMLDCLAKLYEQQRPDGDDNAAPDPDDSADQGAPAAPAGDHVTGPESSAPASAKTP